MPTIRIPVIKGGMSSFDIRSLDSGTSWVVTVTTFE